MAVALVVLSVAVVALSGALAVVARQENPTEIPGEVVETQSGAEPTAVSEAAADPVEELVDEQPDSDKLAATTVTPDAATVEIAGDPPEEPVEENAGTDELDATTATPDAATVEAAGDPPEEPVGGLSEDDYAVLVELASSVKAGTIIFPEDEDGEITYRFYTGKEYPLVVWDNDEVTIKCPRPDAEWPSGSLDEQRENIRKYYEQLNRELGIINPNGDFTYENARSLWRNESERAQTFHHMYSLWLSNNVPFRRSIEPMVELYDDQGNYMGVGTKISVCPKVHLSDIAPESKLSPFTQDSPVQFVEGSGAGVVVIVDLEEGVTVEQHLSTTVEEIEDWWESRNGGD